ncbi:MAG: DUF2911 domain-containing protein [Gemmatimonadales bacterium]
MRRILLAAASITCVPLPAAAQLPACQFRGAPDALHERAAPLDSITIRLGEGAAKLCYGRPSAGGTARVGAEFPYGAPWQLGANEPTTLHVSFPARLGSVNLEPGSYSLYAIPAPGDWTVVVNGNPNRWGLPIDAEVRAADIGSFPLPTSELSDYEDRLTFRFEPAGERDGLIVYSWEHTTLAIPFAHR